MINNINHLRNKNKQKKCLNSRILKIISSFILNNILLINKIKYQIKEIDHKLKKNENNLVIII